MAEFGMEWQRAQTVASTQGSRVGVFCRLGSNDLLNDTGAACGARTKNISYPGDFAHDSVGSRIPGHKVGPAALGQRGQERRRRCDG
jgi:hypothetical protein